MRAHGQHRDPVPRPSETGRPDLHRGPPGHRERRQARRGTFEGRAEGRQVRGDLLEVLPAAGPRPGRRPGEAREQRDALRQAEQRDGPHPPHGGLPGPHAGRAVRAERFHPQGAEAARRAPRLHPRWVWHGPDGDEAAGPRGRDGPGAREGDGEVRRRVLARRARGRDCRSERPAVGPRPAVRDERGLPHGRDIRILRGSEVRAGGTRSPHKISRHRNLVQRVGDEGEADRPDHGEAEGHRGRAGDAGKARRPRVYWLTAKYLYARRGLILVIGMGDDETRKAFLKGFEDGLKAAWREIASLMSRGYSSTELMVFAKSKIAVLYRDVEAMEARLLEEEGIPVVGGGEMVARKDLRRRGAYLVREPKAERVFELFGDLLRSEARGLCITRIHPDDARTRYGLETAGFIWLSKSPGQKGKDMAIAEPTALVDIASAISEFASDGGNAAVLLEGLEYLISQNGFPSVMRFLQKVNEKIVINDSYLLISANPAAMKEQEYTVLAKEVAGEV